TSSRVVGTNPDIFSTSSLKSLGLVRKSKTIFQSQLVVVTYLRFKRRTILAASSASMRPLDNIPTVSFVRIAFFNTAMDSVIIMNDFRIASTEPVLSFFATASSSFLRHLCLSYSAILFLYWSASQGQLSVNRSAAFRMF